MAAPPPQAGLPQGGDEPGSGEWELDRKLAAAGGVEKLAAALRRAEVQATLTTLYLR